MLTCRSYLNTCCYTNTRSSDMYFFFIKYLVWTSVHNDKIQDPKRSGFRGTILGTSHEGCGHKPDGQIGLWVDVAPDIVGPDRTWCLRMSIDANIEELLSICGALTVGMNALVKVLFTMGMVHITMDVWIWPQYQQYKERAIIWLSY